MRFVFALLFIPFLMFAEPVHAEEAYYDDEMLAEYDDMERMMQEEEARFLEQLKEENPEAYNNYLQIQQRQANIQGIVEAYSSGRLSEPDARNQIRTVLEEYIDVNQRTSYIDEEIGHLQENIRHLESEIARLQAVKANPDIIIEEQIDRYLQTDRSRY
jgi:predicted  nucleic acid-binding Zn-ribbon protein